MLDARLVIVSGKGGVGKSAVTAAIALLAHRQGKKVLAVEMGDQGSLASHFSTTDLAFEPREVQPGLHAMHVVRSEALLEYLTLQLRLPVLARFGAVGRAFDALATAAPAIREIITMGKVIWEARSETWDIVIADGPPTGQIGSYLRAPRSINELVPTGRISSQADTMASTLADPDVTQLVLVNVPEELPTTETRETIDWLNEEQLTHPPFVAINRVVPALTVSKKPSGVAGDIVDLHRSVVSEQEHWLGEISGDVRLPYLFGFYTPGEVAAHLSDVLEANR